MKFDAQAGGLALTETAGEAARLERIGFDTFWTFESAHNPFLPLIQAATATTRMQIGTNIAVAFARAPFATAQAAWDLQQASGGRMHLGLGTQVRAHVERRFSMPFDQPAARVTDYIRCVRAIWNSFQTGAPADYEGPFYRFQLINPFFDPGPIDNPDIPIYLAGVNERMCAAAGEAADGFHVHPMHSIGYLRDIALPAIGKGAAARGKTAADLELAASVFAITGETQAEKDAAEQEVRRQVSMYASTPNYRVVMEYHGFGALARELSVLVRRGEYDAMVRLVPDALLAEVAVVADISDLGAALRKRYDGLLGRVSLYQPIPLDDPEEKWQAVVAGFRAAA